MEHTATVSKWKAFTREMAPASHRVWLQEQEDENEMLQKAFASWMKGLADAQNLFKKHVYENPDFNEFDLRQHRASLCSLIHDGEFLAYSFIKNAGETGKIEEIQPTLALIDQKVKEMLEVLFAWHAPLKSQSDIPDSFKQAAQEVEEGKIVDLDV